MISRTIQQEREGYFRKRSEQVPNVVHASAVLHTMLGFEQGMHLLNNMVVKLWELPTPPNVAVRGRLDEHVDALRTRPQRCQRGRLPLVRDVSDDGDTLSDDTWGESEISLSSDDANDEHGHDDKCMADENDDGEGQGGLIDDEHDALRSVASVNERKDSAARAMLKLAGASLGSQDTDTPVAFKEQLPTTRLDVPRTQFKVPQTVIDLIQESPQADLRHHRHIVDLTQTASGGNDRHRLDDVTLQLLDPIADDLNFWLPDIQPPPDHRAPADAVDPQRPLPCYWVSTLSQLVHRWFHVPGIAIRHTTLQRLVLKTIDGWDQHVFSSTNTSKLRITQLDLPTQYAGLQRWNVVEVQLVAQNTYVDGCPVPTALTLPYWLLVFPAAAVVFCRSRDRGRGKPQGRWTGETMRDQITEWRLGPIGMMPPMHGRGIKEKFADDWMRGVAHGLSMLELRSEEQINL